jgi:hypothetical protein
LRRRPRPKLGCGGEEEEEEERPSFTPIQNIRQNYSFFLYFNI